jgi:hypothetical protein
MMVYQQCTLKLNDYMFSSSVITNYVLHCITDIDNATLITTSLCFSVPYAVNKSEALSQINFAKLSLLASLCFSVSM